MANDSDISPGSHQDKSPSGDQYIVIARRYRPQSFDELVGQQQVCQGLTGAIETNRVGHAYLFTGARGTGKTSTARILAKALNCQQGPTVSPCNECDICQSIAVGDDVDVLEIDGASNRGIDEIRQLRSNVNIRPSRSRFKIYIIDEVHMLTTPAFNALLKTLEEPPKHVKFFFCTTDPEKIPITVLSRCQRFDFAPVESEAIAQRLQHIVVSEGIEVDDEALQLLARRAGGSMRDSQSLLEQLLSFCDKRITIDDVHTMLGTAPSGRLAQLAACLVSRDTAAVLAELDAAVSEGVDVGQLTEQLLGYFRDMMAAAAGCSAELMLHTSPSDFDKLSEAANQLGLETVLAVLQILDTTVTRMRQSTHLRALTEMALVRICKLEDLDQLATLVDRLQSGAPISNPSPPSRPSESRSLQEKKTEIISSEPATVSAAIPVTGELDNATVERLWRQTLAEMGDMTAEFAGHYDRVAISAPNRLVVSFQAQYNHHVETCQRPGSKERIERVLSKIAGRNLRIDFEVLPCTAPPQARQQPLVTKRQRMREIEKHPLVHQAMKLFDGEVIDLTEPRQGSGDSSAKP